MKKFNVLIWNFNSDKLQYYDILPYFRRCYKEQIKNSKKYPREEYWIVPKTIEDFKKFIESKSQYQFWARCEYEMIIQGWPVQKRKYKLDIHEQIMMNIDIISEIFFNEQINNSTN